MGDYISRETAVTIIGRLRDKCGNDEMAFALNWALRLLRDAPAANVVEADSCGDCMKALGRMLKSKGKGEP